MKVDLSSHLHTLAQSKAALKEGLKPAESKADSVDATPGGLKGRQYDAVDIEMSKADHSQFSSSAKVLFKSEPPKEGFENPSVPRELTVDTSMADLAQQRGDALLALKKAQEGWFGEAKAKGLDFNGILRYQKESFEKFVLSHSALWGLFGISPEV